MMIMVLFLPGNTADGQKKIKKIVISGFVTDVNNNPVIGAAIFTDGHNTDILTDDKGFFKLKVRPDVKVIKAFTFAQGVAEVALDGKTTIRIILDGSFSVKNYEPEKQEADETVNIGYGTAKKKDMSTETNQIDATQDKYNVYTNIFEMITAEVPGVQIVGSQVLIRGITSVQMSNEALYVVDGTIVSSIAGINPREVKSISVLKGAAAAIYGSRAGNGVILIELKGRKR